MKKFPLEFYALVVPVAIIFATFSSVSQSFRYYIGQTFSLGAASSFAFNYNPIFQYSIYVLAVYMAYKMVLFLYRRFGRAKKPDGYPYFVLSFLSITLTIVMVSLFACILIGWLYYIADPEKVLRTSDMLMDLDLTVFSVYPPFWLHTIPAIKFFEPAIYWSYNSLGLAVSVCFVFLFFGDKELFRKFITVFFITTVVSIPIWFAVQAISPADMYLLDRLAVGVPDPVKLYLLSHPYSPLLLNRVIGLSVNFAGGISQKVLAISCFPSMHAAWALIVAYFGWKLWRPLGTVLTAWALGLALGAVYLGQHYAVDVLAGLLVAILAIILGNFIFRRFGDEEGHPVFLVLDTAVSDMGKIRQKIRTVVKTLSSFERIN